MLDFEAFKERYEKVPVEEYPNNVREAVPDPVVSVHLLTYNHADYIREAIESVLMQEVDFPMEIVLGDDDSSDGTREICIEYAKQHPDLIRLQLHHRENNIHLHGGPTHLFQYWYNTLSARGKYIAILSGDDYWTDPLKLQKQYDFLETKNGFVLSFHNAKVVSNEGKVVDESKTPDENKRYFSHEGVMKGPYLSALSLFVLNIYKSVPEALIFCFNEDKVTISLAGQHGKGAYQEEIEPAVYRMHDESIWSSNTSKHKFEAHSNTFKRLSIYYAKEDADVASYYGDRYISSKKGVYYASVREGVYRDSFRTWTYIVRYHAKRKNYRQAVSFGLNAFRFLLGDIRKRLLRS